MKRYRLMWMMLYTFKLSFDIYINTYYYPSDAIATATAPPELTAESQCLPHVLYISNIRVSSGASREEEWLGRGRIPLSIDSRHCKVRPRHFWWLPSHILPPAECHGRGWHGEITTEPPSEPPPEPPPERAFPCPPPQIKSRHPPAWGVKRRAGPFR